MIFSYILRLRVILHHPRANVHKMPPGLGQSYLILKRGHNMPLPINNFLLVKFFELRFFLLLNLIDKLWKNLRRTYPSNFGSLIHLVLILAVNQNKQTKIIKC